MPKLITRHIYRSTYTAADAFFEAIWDAGITHCFVNLGSDHPAIMEAITRGQRLRRDEFPEIITCPSELVALSMADGFARRSGNPQCVIVHVDVGTQAMGAAVHNASTGRVPVLIFAGLSPITAEGEMRGSRSEYIHWIQDVPDQKQIVAQYCRYTGEIRTGKNIKQVVNRALQFATNDPAGPVYLTAAREIMEEDIKPYQLRQSHWGTAKSGALPEDGLALIADALISAKRPLIIVGYTGRNPEAVARLVALADLIPGVRVLDTGGSHMCFPFSHPASVGMRYGVDPSITEADFLLVVDCDVPYVPLRFKPRADARIIHIDLDPLKQMMPLFYIDAEERYRADSSTAFQQIHSYIASHPSYSQQVTSEEFSQRGETVKRAHEAKIQSLNALAVPSQDGGITTPYLAASLRKLCPPTTLWVVEAVTQTFAVADQLRPDLPGTWFNSGGAGLGWSGGAAIGVKLAEDFLAGGRGKGNFVCEVVGDGTFLFGAPSSAYWIAQCYGISTLTIVLNNKGWNAPRHSLMVVHPRGEGSKVSNDDLHISFEPSPHYAEIAKAASGGRLWAGVVNNVEDLVTLLPEAIASVKAGVGAVLDVRLANAHAAGGFFTQRSIKL